MAYKTTPRNNRIIETKEPDWSIVYGVHEVYYHLSKRRKQTHSRSSDSMIWYFDSKEEIVEYIELLLADVKKDRPIMRPNEDETDLIEVLPN